MNGYGFFKSIGKFFKKFWRPLLAILVTLALRFEILPAILPSLGVPGAAVPFISAGISGGIGNIIVTGRPKAFLAGFGQSVLSFGASGLNPVTRTVANAVIGGAFSEIRGGSFSSGFLSAGFSSAAGTIQLGDQWQAAAVAAAAGGVGSILGGGKFADGAVTSAFSYLATNVAVNYVLGRTSFSGGVELPAEERQKLFERARNDLKLRGLIPPGYRLNFDNRFAVAKYSLEKGLSDYRYFDTYDAAVKAVGELGPDYTMIGGSTAIGVKSSTIYAGATMGGTGYVYPVPGLAGKPITVDGFAAVQFTILHEIQHGLGIYNENIADQKALQQLGLFGGKN